MTENAADRFEEAAGCRRVGNRITSAASATILFVEDEAFVRDVT